MTKLDKVKTKFALYAGNWHTNNKQNNVWNATDPAQTSPWYNGSRYGSCTPNSGASGESTTASIKPPLPAINFLDGYTDFARNRAEIQRYVHHYTSQFANFPSAKPQEALDDLDWLRELFNIERDMEAIKKWVCRGTQARLEQRISKEERKQAGIRTAAWQSSFRPLAQLARPGEFMNTEVCKAGRACRELDSCFGSMYDTENGLS